MLRSALDVANDIFSLQLVLERLHNLYGVLFSIRLSLLDEILDFFIRLWLRIFETEVFQLGLQMSKPNRFAIGTKISSVSFEIFRCFSGRWCSNVGILCSRSAIYENNTQIATHHHHLRKFSRPIALIEFHFPIFVTPLQALRFRSLSAPSSLFLYGIILKGIM